MVDGGSTDAPIHFVFDAPTTQDIIAGTALSANAGLHWLDLFGLTPEQVSTSHLIRCGGSPPLLSGSIDHCRRHDVQRLETLHVFTHSLRQGFMVPAYRRLIALDVAKAKRLADRGEQPCVWFGADCFRHALPQAAEVDDDLRRWRGHIHAPNRDLLSWYPPIVKSRSWLKDLLDSTDGPIGLDLEYDPDNQPTILGLAFRRSDGSYICGAIPWNQMLAHDVANSGRQLVAYSAHEADRPVFEAAVGDLGSHRWEDPMQLHWLHNRDLFDVPSAEDGGTSIMLMGLWTAASIVLDIPNWKKCRGLACEGSVCPRHDKLGYCAIDAWSGLALFHHYTERT